jgi:CRISPR-associated exonuclease Cas4
VGITVGLALLLVAVLIIGAALRMRATTGLPWVPVRYDDSGAQVIEKPLTSRRLALSGRPDYLLDVRGRTVPVEVKPTRTSPVPYASDLLQLAAYCVLVEETEGVAPPYGLLRYADQSFRLAYTPRVRDDVLATLEEMRAALAAPDCDRSHDDARRCAACGFVEQCTLALV